MSARATHRRRAKMAGLPDVARNRGYSPCVAEPLEDRLLMAAARALGGSGYSGTLSTNPTVRQQQLICDPIEPLQGSTSVFYNPQQVSLAAAVPGPGYNNASFGGFVEVSNFDGGSSLVPLGQFLQNRPQPGSTGETGFVQITYRLTGTAGQIQPPAQNTLVDEGGVDGIDTHALTFDLLPGVPTSATIPYTIRAATANMRSGNAEDFLVVNDGSGTRLGPAQLAQVAVQTNPTNGSLSGTMFEDQDGDGVQDPGDAPLPGVTAFLDTNNNGSRETAEPARVSDENGMFLFDDLAPGTYNVRRIAPTGFVAAPSVPAGGVRSVTVAAGRRVRGVDFGNVRLPSVRVTNVFVNGTSWSAAFRNFITNRGMGEAAYGLDVGSGAPAQLPLPWASVNQVSLRFSTPANVGMFDLVIRGGRNPTYAVTGFAYDPASRTATWSLAAALPVERVLLDLNGDAGGVADPSGASLLDGESVNGALPSGNGTPGGDFRFALNVVPGDARRDGTTDVIEAGQAKQRTGANTTNNTANYSIYYDFNTNGVIDVIDAGQIKQRAGTTISNIMPAGAAGAAPQAIVDPATLTSPRRNDESESDELTTLLA